MCLDKFVLANLFSTARLEYQVLHSPLAGLEFFAGVLLGQRGQESCQLLFTFCDVALGFGFDQHLKRCLVRLELLCFVTDPHDLDRLELVAFLDLVDDILSLCHVTKDAVFVV